MTAFRDRAALATLLAALAGVGFSIAQPPKADEKKKEEPPTKEELALRQGSRDFLYKFTPGEEIQCEARQKRVEHRSFQGKLRSDTAELRMEFVLAVESLLPKGGADLNARVKWVTFNRVSPTEVKKYDSRKPENPENASEGWELYAPPAQFKVRVDPRGKVSDIRPDSETAAFWKQQHRELRALVEADVIRSLLPFVALPTDLVRRGTDWKETRTIVDPTFGKREVTLKFSYHGSETVRGRTYEDIRLRAEAKQLDAKPKYEIVEHRGDGQVSFDMALGNLRTFRFEETYLFNPPGAPLVDEPDEKENKKSGRAGGGPPGGRAGSGAGGPPGGYPGGGDPRGGGMKGTKKKSKEERKKEKEEAENRPPNKSVKVDLENEVRLTYRGKSLGGD